MAEKKPQTLKNHSRIVPGYHVGVFGLLMIVLLWSLARLVHPFISDSVDFNFGRVIWVIQSLALVGLFFYARLFPLAAQDRLIRLEERLRLAETLPEDLRGRIGELSTGQLIALRFASDGELSELVRDVLDNDVKNGTEIKQKIKEWRPDYCRV